MKPKKDAKYRSPMAQAVLEAYQRGEEDETMNPLVLVRPDGKPAGAPEPGDSLIFYDIRGEREVEISEPFVDRDFPHFPVREWLDLRYVTMIRYHEKLNARVAFPPIGAVAATLSETVGRAGLRQAKVVETEKLVHLTYFLNGKNRDPFPGEEHHGIPSPTVPDYTAVPELEAEKVAETIADRIADPEIALVTANFANMDVLGHLEDDDAAIRAVEMVDGCVGRVAEAARAAGADVLITADHGTVEKRLYPEGTKDTGHTDSPVPLIYLAADGGAGVTCRAEGALTDVAPTALAILGLEKPAEMTGENLLSGLPEKKGRRLLLVIADGWGYREETDGNLVAAAKTPNMDRFLAENPHGLLAASGEAVGLPEGTVGNSEAGHLHIGAGRVIYSDRLRIDKAIGDGSFRTNEAFTWAMDGAAKNDKTLHLLGIVSFFSSHGSLDHLMELLEMAKERGVKKVCVHSLLGRRGERPEAGAAYIEAVDDKCHELGIGSVCTVTGRFWALDREENWDRVEKAYRAIAFGDGRNVPEA